MILCCVWQPDLDIAELHLHGRIRFVHFPPLKSVPAAHLIEMKSHRQAALWRLFG